jgi:hypothetical protein
MFRQQQPAARKPRAKAGPRPFVDFINWTDYHWESNTWRSAATMPWAQGARQPRRYTFLQVFLTGLAVVVALKLMAALKNSAALTNSALKNSRNRSWVERSALAVLLLLVASYVSKQRRA